MPHGAKEPRMATSGRSWTARPILSADLTEDVPTEAVYIGRLRERKNIAKAIQSIAVAQPGFGHLKRCSASRLLLAPIKITRTAQEDERNINETQGAEENDMLTTEQLRSRLTAKGFDLTLLEEDFEVIEVPTRAPKTKAQAQACAIIWPVNFHPDPNVEAIISGTIFDEERLQQIGRYTEVAVEAARTGASGKIECNGGAVVVDPEDGEILAITASRTDEHPMWHAAMLAIDLVAKLQGGGAWDLEHNTNSRYEGKRGISKHEGETEGNIEMRRNDDDFNAMPVCGDLDSGNSVSGFSGRTAEFDEEEKISDISQKRKYIGDSPLCFPEKLLDIVLPEPKPLEVKTKQRNGTSRNKNKDSGYEVKKGDATSSTLLEEIPKEALEACDKSAPYLCTNYWVFMVREPCALCAMALLHSRVARIFYGAPSTNFGVLGSKAILHATSGLNHRYQVWSGILEKECNDVLREIEFR